MDKVWSKLKTVKSKTVGNYLFFKKKLLVIILPIMWELTERKTTLETSLKNNCKTKVTREFYRTSRVGISLFLVLNVSQIFSKREHAFLFSFSEGFVFFLFEKTVCILKA